MSPYQRRMQSVSVRVHVVPIHGVRHEGRLARDESRRVLGRPRLLAEEPRLPRGDTHRHCRQRHPSGFDVIVVLAEPHAGDSGHHASLWLLEARTGARLLVAAGGHLPTSRTPSPRRRHAARLHAPLLPPCAPREPPANAATPVRTGRRRMSRPCAVAVTGSVPDGKPQTRGTLSLSQLNRPGMPSAALPSRSSFCCQAV